jgi:hypothetical protein
MSIFHSFDEKHTRREALKAALCAASAALTVGPSVSGLDRTVRQGVGRLGVDLQPFKVAIPRKEYWTTYDSACRERGGPTKSEARTGITEQTRLTWKS